MLPVAVHSPCFLSNNPSLFRLFTHQTLSHATNGYPLTLLPLLYPSLFKSFTHLDSVTATSGCPLTLCFLSFNPSHFSSSLIQTLSHATYSCSVIMIPLLYPFTLQIFTHSDIATCYQWLPTHPASYPLTLNLQVIHSFIHCHMLPVAAHSPCFLSFNPSLFRSITHSVIVTCY